jgi:FkbM family methyltransferase
MQSLLRRTLRRLGLDLVRYHPPPVVEGAPSWESGGVRFLAEDAHRIPYLSIELDGDRYFVPGYATHRPAARSIVEGRRYEPWTHHLVHEFCSRHDGSIIHAGTFFGDMLPSFSRSVRGTVYAFEPVPENHELARLCVEHNGLKNVFLLQAALGESTRILRIDTRGVRGGGHAGGGSRISDTGELCPTVAIDAFGIDDLLLIELDVEGHELEALRGGVESIRRCRPLIAIEDNNDSCSEFLAEHGYRRHATIPGLHLWVPSERRDFADQIDRILTGPGRDPDSTEPIDPDGTVNPAGTRSAGS